MPGFGKAPRLFTHTYLLIGTRAVPQRSAACLKQNKCQSGMGNQSEECGYWEILAIIAHSPPCATTMDALAVSDGSNKNTQYMMVIRN